MLKSSIQISAMLPFQKQMKAEKKKEKHLGETLDLLQREFENNFITYQ